MPSTLKRKRRSSLDDLPPAFNVPFNNDDASVAPLWERYHADRSTDAYQQLMIHYAPLVAATARHAKRRKSMFYHGTVDDMVSDGVMGLIDAITSQRAGMAHFRLWAIRKIRSFMIRGEMNRRWGKEFRFVRDSIVAELRARAVQDLGRLPTPEEMTERLRGRIPNPAFYASHDPREFSRSQATTKEERRALGNELGINRHRPDQSAIDRETMKLALKGLNVQDRKILKLVLAGHNSKEIGALLRLPLGTHWKRVNGVLWEARQRGDLAAYLDVEPSGPPPMKHRHPIAITRVPAARMVG